MMVHNMNLRETTENKVLSLQAQSALIAHGISSTHIPNFIKDEEHSYPSYLAQAFELSEAWLKGESTYVTEPLFLSSTDPSQFEKLTDVLSYYKQQNWKPSCILVKPFQQSPQEGSVIVLIELLKQSKIGILFKTYRQINVETWEAVGYLCEEAGLYYCGIDCNTERFNRLKEHQMMPTEVFKDAKNLWFPKLTDIKETALLSELSARIRYTHSFPYLHNPITQLSSKMNR
jgi:hypothetical protein